MTMPYLCSGVVNNLLTGQIALVTDQQFVHVLVSVAVNLVKPCLDVVEAVLVSDVIHNLQELQNMAGMPSRYSGNNADNGCTL